MLDHRTHICRLDEHNALSPKRTFENLQRSVPFLPFAEIAGKKRYVTAYETRLVLHGAERNFDE